MGRLIEEWRDIKGYEGLYQVSNLGKVRNKKGKVLKQYRNNKGYPCVHMYKNNKYKTKNVHRLVAISFIENPNNLPQVNHKDEDKTNNVVTNLEWCTNKYNCNYGNHRRNVSIGTKL